MKILALAFALALGLATPGFAAERGHDGGHAHAGARIGGAHVGVGGHMNHGGVGAGARIGGAHVGVGFGGGERHFHRFHRGYHGGFIGGPYYGPYYGDPCWNWVPVIGWLYVCD